MNRWTGKDLLEAGYPQGPLFGKALEYANKTVNTVDELRKFAVRLDELNNPPKLQLQGARELTINLEPSNDLERENLVNVIETMEVVMRTPTVTEGVIMPDACPAGPLGTIPVGGIIATEGTIHPGMHSADICCSMMVTEFKDADPKVLLDAVNSVTHFGPGGRPDGQRFSLSQRLAKRMTLNPWLNSTKAMEMAVSHMGTQGDGNHFAFVGTNNAGNTCLVTHHGSRGPGAMLYKKGMAEAIKHTQKVAEGVLKQNSWLDFDSADGQSYWEALQTIRHWTKDNHSCLHTAAAQVANVKVLHRRWNEHNFVFQDGDTFFHAKGATPIHDQFLPDTDGVQIVPLNMAQPVLLIEGTRNSLNKGFAPHGAGRNISRTKHKKSLGERSDEDVFAEETKGLDTRFYSGRIDVSELPSAYKDGPAVRSQMESMGLATVVDEIQPYGSIMAGDCEYDAPWRKKRREKGRDL